MLARLIIHSIGLAKAFIQICLLHLMKKIQTNFLANPILILSGIKICIITFDPQKDAILSNDSLVTTYHHHFQVKNTYLELMIEFELEPGYFGLKTHTTVFYLFLYLKG